MNSNRPAYNFDLIGTYPNLYSVKDEASCYQNYAEVINEDGIKIRQLKEVGINFTLKLSSKDISYFKEDICVISFECYVDGKLMEKILDINNDGIVNTFLPKENQIIVYEPKTKRHTIILDIPKVPPTEWLIYGAFDFKYNEIIELRNFKLSGGVDYER